MLMIWLGHMESGIIDCMNTAESYKPEEIYKLIEVTPIFTKIYGFLGIGNIVVLSHYLEAGYNKAK